MADIENETSRDQFLAGIRAMDDSELMAQELVQQGAIHAISTLLANGCTEELAGQMLASLRENAASIRHEVARRGAHVLFQQDQIEFH